MIGLEYIVKLYNGTYKKLAEKLEITPSAVTDWLSKRRPIPKAKLEALAKLFRLEETYFQKELTKVEKIELRLDYFNRLSKRETFEITDLFTDEDGKEHEYKRIIDSHEDETRMASEELKIEKTTLNLQRAMYNGLYASEISNKTQEMLERLSTVLHESVPHDDNDEQSQQWEEIHDRRMEALRSMMYLMGIDGYTVWDEEEESFHAELYKLLKKHDLFWIRD